MRDKRHGDAKTNPPTQPPEQRDLVIPREQVEESLRALTRRNQAILQTFPDIIAEVDENKVYTWVNDAALEFFGEDVIGREASYYFATEQETYDSAQPIFTGDSGTRYVESWQRRKDGEKRLLAWWCRSVRDDNDRVTGALSTARDVTERWWAEAMRNSRLRLLELAPAITVQEFLRAALRELELLTTSPIGFCNFLAADEESYTAASWASIDPDDVCKMPPESVHHMISEAGVWADCARQRQAVIYNDLSSLTHRKGTPSGHAELSRILTVPVFRNNKIVAVFAVGNKPTDYTERDVETVASFADLTWDTAARKQAEAALQDSDAFNRRLFDSGPDAVFLSEPDGHFLDCNRTAIERYGYSHEELRQMTYRDLAALDLRDTAGAHVSQTLAQGGAVFERRHRRKDGSELPVEIRTAPFMAQGKQRIMATVRDLTKAKEAEEALHQSEERFRSLSAMTTEGIMIHEEGIIVDANRAFAELVGYHDADELIGKPGLEILPATQESREELLRHLRSRDSQTFVIELVRPDGSRTWAETRGREVMYRGQPARLVFMRDVTERKLAEEALRRSEREFRALFEAAPMGIGVADKNGRILAFNDAILEPGGYTREDIEDIGNVGALYYDSGERETSLALFHAQGSLCQHETRFKRKDGSPYEVWLSLTHTTFNGVPATQAIVLDRTEERRVEEERERLQAQLRQAAKMESIGRLAGGVAHDFNNMLAVILGHSELALGQVSQEDKLREDLAEIRRAAERSAGITQQLLAFARRQVALPKVLSLNKAVRGMLGMLRTLIGEQVDLVWLPGHGSDRVQIDPAQLDQVLVNLCLNARDATTGPGRVLITTAEVTLDEDFCSQHDGCLPGDYVRLSVSDNGAGMSPEALEHLFEPFFTTKDAGKGTGLGLATVYGIVTQNHGHIYVQSEDEKGTEVDIYLPRVDAEITEEERERPCAGSPGGVETLLVIEDEPSVLRLTERILRSLDYTVLTARAPAEALRVTREHPSDIALAITDIVMPEMNGWRLAEKLQEMRPSMRILYVSGYTDEMINGGSVLREDIDFLQKPFTPQDLAAAVRAILDRE